MKQKDIYMVNLNPSKESEQAGKRPVVIISGNTMNDNLPVRIICPLSTKIKNFAGCVVLNPDKQNGLKQASEIITFQVRTVSIDRFEKKIGEVSNDDLVAIFQGLNDILAY